MIKILFRIFAILFFFVYIYRGNNFTHDKFLHYPAKEQIADSYDNLTNLYKQGSYYQTDRLSWDEKLFRKKINNFLFITENKRKIEIALIDLNFASAINVNYFGENRTHSFERQFGFSLSQDFNDHVVTIKNNANQRIFEYSSEEKVFNDKQTIVSYFKVKEINGKSTFQLTLTHYQPTDRCLTFMRDGVISFKCYGGKAQGQYSIMIKEFGTSSFFQEKQKLYLESSTAVFDGFRASGFKWYWIWGMGSGKNQKGQYISINFGSIRDIGEDFLYINNYTIPIKAIQYQINENKTIGDSFNFRSAQPPMLLTFYITAKQHKYKDMFLLKNDMVKFQGYWSGRFQDPVDSQIYEFQRFAGLVETANSIF